MYFDKFEEYIKLVEEARKSFQKQISKDGGEFEVKLPFKFDMVRCKANKKAIEEFLLIVKENLETVEVPFKCGKKIYLLTYSPLVKRWVVVHIIPLGG